MDHPEQIARQLQAVIERAKSIFADLKLSPAETDFANTASVLLVQQVFELWQDQRRAGSKSLPTIAMAAALASALSLLDGFAQVSDELFPHRGAHPSTRFAGDGSG